MMTVNDIIVLLTLIIALLAIINEKKRSHLRLKFHRLDYVIFGISFLLINYFVFYGAFYSLGIKINALYFYGFGFHNPKNYAYVITIVSLSYLLYKIWWSFYPIDNIEKVGEFYQKQIEDGEFSFVIDLIEYYHKKDILKYFKKRKDNVKQKDGAWLMERYRIVPFREKVSNWITLRVRNLFPFSWYNRRDYAHNVLNFVIDSPGFICHVSNLRPYFFPPVFANFTEPKRGAYPEELINSYLKELLTHQNYWLRKELRESENFDKGQPENFHEGNKILSALTTDLSVAQVNQVWQPFGNAAKNEIETERFKGYDSRLFEEYLNDEQLWEFKTQYTIQFLNMVVAEAIARGFTGSHFWIFYYQRIAEHLTETWTAYPLRPAPAVQTVGEKLIDEIFDNLTHLLRFSNEKAHPGFYHDLLSCIGGILEVMMRCPSYDKAKKAETIDRLINYYLDLKENTETEAFRVKFESTLLNPSMLMDDTNPYFAIFGEAWKKFDKVPYSHGRKDLPAFARFKAKVIVPLGLNPDQH